MDPFDMESWQGRFVDHPQNALHLLVGDLGHPNRSCLKLFQASHGLLSGLDLLDVMDEAGSNLL